MNTPSPDRQTDAGKTAFETFWQKIAPSIPKPSWESMGQPDKEDWHRVASVVLAKHMPQVTPGDVADALLSLKRGMLDGFSCEQKTRLCQRASDFLNARLRSRLVPEAAAEWEEQRGREWNAAGIKLSAEFQVRVDGLFQPVNTELYGTAFYDFNLYRRPRQPAPDYDHFKPWTTTVQPGDELSAVRCGPWCATISGSYIGQSTGLWVRRKKQAESPTQECHTSDITVCEQKPAPDFTSANAGRPSGETASTVTPNIALNSKSGGESGFSGEGGKSPQAATDGATVESSVVEGYRREVEKWKGFYVGSQDALTASRDQLEGLKKELAVWTENMTYLVSAPHGIRSCEGGGKENLAQSVCLTMASLQSALTAAQKERDEARDELKAKVWELDTNCKERVSYIQRKLDKANAEIARLKEEVRKWGEKESQAVERLATLRTAPKGLMVEQVRMAVFESKGSRVDLTDRLNAILSTQPASPWTQITSDPKSLPTKEDADRNGNVAVLFENGQIMSLQWKDLADHITKAGTHWRTTDLPLTAVVEDDPWKIFVRSMGDVEVTVEQTLRMKQALDEVLSTKTGGAA